MLCIIISICIYLVLNYCIPKTNNVKISAKLIQIENKQEVFYDVIDSDLSNKWSLEIPKINLVAEIKEGTDEKTLNQYIGHFEETSTLDGNIGLAAHNRGYNVNYFARIKELTKKDKIFYTYKGKIVEFEVIDYGIISETDWSKLEKTEESKLTLITCVEDRPEYRRFVQAKKIDMEEKGNEEDFNIINDNF